MKPPEVSQEHASATTGSQEEQQVKPTKVSQEQATATTGPQEEQQATIVWCDGKVGAYFSAPM